MVEKEIIKAKQQQHLLTKVSQPLQLQDNLISPTFLYNNDSNNNNTKPDKRLSTDSASSPPKTKKAKTTQQFPTFTVWEADDSFLVALEVPGIVRDTLKPTISVVELDVSGVCQIPEKIAQKWQGTGTFLQRKFRQVIQFVKPIDPNNSGLIDIDCEGFVFYKCAKQNVQSFPLRQISID